MTSKGIAVVVGVGPKLGRAIARKFAHVGYAVAILARDLDRLSVIADGIGREEKAQVFAIRIDCSDAKSVREAFEVIHSLGNVEVLVYNVSNTMNQTELPEKGFVNIPVESFEKALAVSVVGAFHCAQQVLLKMSERGRGTIIFTGSSASISGTAGLYELCCGKFALRGLAQCLAREFHPKGVHVAHVIIDGAVGQPRSSSYKDDELMHEEDDDDQYMNPDKVANAYLHIHSQDKSAWTHELDLRSYIRSF